MFKAIIVPMLVFLYKIFAWPMLLFEWVLRPWLFRFVWYKFSSHAQVSGAELKLRQFTTKSQMESESAPKFEAIINSRLSFSAGYYSALP